MLDSCISLLSFSIIVCILGTSDEEGKNWESRINKKLQRQVVFVIATRNLSPSCVGSILARCTRQIGGVFHRAAIYYKFQLKASFGTLCIIVPSAVNIDKGQMHFLFRFAAEISSCEVCG